MMEVMPRTQEATLATLLGSGAPSDDSATAIILPEPVNQSTSYAQLRALVLEFSRALTQQLGVKTGDVVAMSFVNSLEFIVAFLGTGMARYAPIIICADCRMLSPFPGPFQLR
jgi:acyl-CoA synthetase (AMP-forming)/AMP-acid ligase II